MVRISDARMSGTAYGTVVLHTAPEAAAGGPLALVQNGDMIELDVPKRALHLHVSDDELARRRAAVEAADAAADQRLLEAVRRPRAAGRRRRRPRLPGRQARRLRAAGQPLNVRSHARVRRSSSTQRREGAERRAGVTATDANEVHRRRTFAGRSRHRVVRAGTQRPLRTLSRAAETIDAMPMHSLVAVDWGTLLAARRAHRSRRPVLEERASRAASSPFQPAASPTVLQETCGDWMRRPRHALPDDRHGRQPAGLASRRPTAPARPASTKCARSLRRGSSPARIAIVPGLSCEHDGVPDVMRGEEVQVFGAMDLLGAARRPVRAARHAQQVGARSRAAACGRSRPS